MMSLALVALSATAQLSPREQQQGVVAVSA